MSNAAWKTQEPPALHWFEQTNFAAVIVGSMAYGLHICIFLQCVHSLLKEKRPRFQIWIAFITTLFVCGSLNIIMNVNFMQRAWVDYRAYPGGPLAYLLEQEAQPIHTVGNVVGVISASLAQAILLYRVYAVWRVRWIVIGLSFMYLASFILGIFLCISAGLPTSSLWATVTRRVSVPYWSVSMTFNVLMTLLIIMRLLWMRWEVVKTLGSAHGRMYIGIATVMLESAAPYALISFIFIILYGIGNTAAILFIPLLDQVECIAPMLIALRVANGRALSHDSYGKPSSGHTKTTTKLESLAFAPNEKKSPPATDTAGGISGSDSYDSTAGADGAFHLHTADYPVGSQFHVTQLETVRSSDADASSGDEKV